MARPLSGQPESFREAEQHGIDLVEIRTGRGRVVEEYLELIGHRVDADIRNGGTSCQVGICRQRCQRVKGRPRHR